MNASDIVRAIMAKRRISHGTMANMMNYGSRSAFSSRLLNRTGLRVDQFVKMCDICDFDVVVKDRLSPEQYVLDPETIGERSKREDKDGYGYVTRTGRSDLGGDEPGV